MQLKAALSGIFCLFLSIAFAQSEEDATKRGMRFGIEPIGVNLGPINFGVVNSIKKYNYPTISLYGNFDHRGWQKGVKPSLINTSGLIVGGLLAGDRNINHSGIASSGLMIEAKKTNGILLAGLGSVIGTDINGLAIGGIVNVAERSNGLSISGLVSQFQKINGIQLSPGISTPGFISSVENFTKRCINGISINGIANIDQHLTNGIAITGLLNDCRHVNGVSISAGIIGFNPDFGLRSFPFKLSDLEEFYDQYERNGEETSELRNPVFNGLGISSVIHTFRASGITFGILRNTSQFLHKGVQSSLIYSGGYEVDGLAITGLVNRNHYMNGLSISITNITKYLRGAQLGIFNSAKAGKGIQIGLFNNVENLYYNHRLIQIGLLNYNGTRKFLKLTPILNFTKKKSLSANQTGN